MVDNIDPRENVDEQLGVSRIPRSHSLNIVGHRRSTVQRLAFLDFADHLLHIHFNLPSVLSESVEAFCDKGEQRGKDYKDRQ